MAPIIEGVSSRNRNRKSIRLALNPFVLFTALGGLVGAAFALRAQTTQQPTVPDSSTIRPEQVDLGRAIFHGQGTCFACHGAKLEGSQIAPTLMPHAWRDAKNGDFAAIYYVATHGVRSTLMVAYPGGISSEQALAVASYVWSVSRGKAKP